jgi:hypothetical protein
LPSFFYQQPWGKSSRELTRARAQPADSEISTESDYDPTNETLGERLYALRDIIPPQTRASISNGVSNTADAVKTVLSFGGKTMWVIATSALLLGVPWALAFSEEQQIMDMEKEMKMREMGGDVSLEFPLTRQISGTESGEPCC